jgi:Fur family transcriptional regulator, peroxide stress response regulator
MKMTPQRMAIMEYLDGNTDHPSAADVFKSVSRKFPTMSFATVYNTLQTLKDKGDLLELSLDPGKKRFDADPRPHHHLICVSCKKIVDVMRSFDLSLPEDERYQFQLIGNHVDFYGICPKCKKRQSGRKPGKAGRKV